MHYIYILKSKIRKSKYYLGVTADIEKRLHKHNSGGNKSTRAFKPWELLYKE